VKRLTKERETHTLPRHAKRTIASCSYNIKAQYSSRRNRKIQKTNRILYISIVTKSVSAGKGGGSNTPSTNSPESEVALLKGT
jgi:hypothetical protein